ncbi:MAG: efflux RND transporter permease subunit [Alphaproteobacteria bacterium]|nr:efflux RND transporter permease subunit [Alphaproteobacteria bacterium]
MPVRAVTRFFVDRWQFTIVLFALLIMLGYSAVLSIPKAEDPIAKFPGVSVTVVLPGADAGQMEKLVAIPLESAVNKLEDVRKIESTSGAGVATISVEFVWGTDPERAYDQVVREVNVVRPTLPDGVIAVDLRKFNPAEAAVVQLALVSETANIRTLEALAKDLRDQIERAPGVQQAQVWGAPGAEVQVSVDLDKLAAYKIPPGLVADALRREGSDAPIGAVEAGARRFNVEASGPFDSLEEIRATAIRAGDGRVVRVGDVATVAWGNEEQRHITRFNGQRALFVTAKGKLGEDVFNLKSSIDVEVADFEARLPAGVKLERGFDQSRTVKERLGKLGRDFAIAILLVLVTLLPLGFRASLIVMVSIPLSLAIGVVAVQALGYSMNQLSIAGFVLALGLLVDDSIVVTENIARRLREGLPPRDAALAGVNEIDVAVIGCTAALLFAFLPLLNLPEGAGEFTRSLPVAVTVTIAASLVVALTIIPFLASRLLPRSAAGHSNFFLDAVMGAIHRTYNPVLHWALERPRQTVIVALAVALASFALVPRIGFSLFPQNDSPYFMIDAELPRGVSVAETDKAIRFAESVLRKHDEVEWYFSNAGRGNPQIYYNVIPQQTQPNVGAIYASFKKWEPGVTTETVKKIRAELATYPGARLDLRRFENGPPIEAPIAVRVQGKDLAALDDLARRVEAIVRDTPGVRDVRNPLAARQVDLDLNVDADKSALLGVTAGAADDALRIAIGGVPVAQFRDPTGDAYPVRVRLATATDVPSADDVRRLYVWTQSGAAIPLAEIAAPTFSSGPATIERLDKERVVTITAYTKDGFLTSRVTQDVAGRLAALDLPPGYKVTFGGQAEASARSFSGLGAAVLVAVFGVLAVLLLEFGTFAMMTTVAFVIPFGVMGGLVALFISGESLSFVAIIGFVALIGIEIKNSILLVDFANKLRETGVPKREAVERAGEIRFLPVLLTSATAIGGLTPLVLEKSPLYSPLAIVIIGGLISSTLLARIVTPAMYLLLAPKDPDDLDAVRAAHAASPVASSGPAA